MTDDQFSQQDLDLSKKLHFYIMSGVFGALGSLNSLYQELRLGGGVFRAKKMDPEIEGRTTLELIGYVAAVLTILLDNWPAKPANLDAIRTILEATLFDAQEKESNPRPQYLQYLIKRGDKESLHLEDPVRDDLPEAYKSLIDNLENDMVLISVHGALATRIIAFWPVFDPNNMNVIGKFSQTFQDINTKIETGLKKLLNETFPTKS